MTLVSGALDLYADFAATWDAEDVACDALGIPRQRAREARQAPEGEIERVRAGVYGVRLARALPLTGGGSVPAGRLVVPIPYPCGGVWVLFRPPVAE